MTRQTKALFFLTLLLLVLRPWPLPAVKSLLTQPLTPLYQPQFTPSSLFTHPLLEQLRFFFFSYFTFLSPDFLFKILYPAEIVLVSLGLYFLARSNFFRLNLLWFALLLISPLVYPSLLVLPLTLLAASGLYFLFSQTPPVWRLFTSILCLLLLFQIIKHFEFVILH